MSGWWFSPAQLVGNSGLDFPLYGASTKPLTLSFSPSPFPREQRASVLFESRCLILPSGFVMWREEGKRANFLEGFKQG